MFKSGFFIVCSLLLLAGCSEPPVPTPIAPIPINIEAASNSAREAVLAQFKSEAEPTAKDAVWTSNTILKIGVYDNQSNRDGYAEYVCSQIYEHGLKGKNIWVQIIDYAVLLKTEKWVKLGEANCL